MAIKHLTENKRVHFKYVLLIYSSIYYVLSFHPTRHLIYLLAPILPLVKPPDLKTFLTPRLFNNLQIVLLSLIRLGKETTLFLVYFNKR